VRVIAGTAKGTRLGPVPEGVRPVADRAREGLFSSLGGLVVGARVLDLYAGTGALGIEALSRGAAEVVFVERSPRAIEALRENLRRTGLEAEASVVRSDVPAFLERASEGRFDLVFVDPPYEAPLEPVLAALDANALLSDGAEVVATRRSRSSIDVIPVDWALARRLAYGDSVLSLFRSRHLEV
jgi:16S rRNA (guanine966-N2)-methyltransferase